MSFMNKADKLTTASHLNVVDEIRNVCQEPNSNNETQELSKVRRQELKNQIRQNGVTRPIYVWSVPDGKKVILDGIEIYEVATELGLFAGIDYPIVWVNSRNGKPIVTYLDAMRWRYEQNISTHRPISNKTAVFKAIELFETEAKELVKQARKNQKNGKKIDLDQKIDVNAYLASKAGVSKSTFKRYQGFYKAIHKQVKNLSPKFTDTYLRQLMSDIDTGEKSVKSVSELIKCENNRYARELKTKKQKVCISTLKFDTDYIKRKSSQIIHGNSLELMECWAALPENQRPCPDVVFGSPPYWLEGSKRINYGPAYLDFLDKNQIFNWKSYQNRFIRRYLKAVYKILPKGGSFIWQVDNTSGIDKNKNRIKYWHTDSIRSIGRKIGFIPTTEIIWYKSEISGRKMANGSRNCPNVRSASEYIVILKKESNRIEGDFDPCEDFDDLTLSFWHEKDYDQLTEVQKLIFHDDVWILPTGRNKNHPATFSPQLAVGIVNLFCPVNGLVLDPWNGTGTTCLAALLSNRNFIGIDIQEDYCQFALERLKSAHSKSPDIKIAGENLPTHTLLMQDTTKLLNSMTNVAE